LHVQPIHFSSCPHVTGYEKIVLAELDYNGMLRGRM